MAIQTFTAAQVLTAAQMNALQANDYNQTVSAKVASYTLVAADKGTRITMSNAAATTITVNTSLFAAGDSLRIQNIGAGICTVTAGTATVTSSGPLTIPQWGGGQLFFTSASASVWFPDAQTTGLTFIASVTPAGAASITFTNCFSATYNSYLMVGNAWTSAGAGADCYLTISGSTGSTYNWGGFYTNYSATTLNGYRAAATNLGFNMGLASTLTNGFTTWIRNPFAAAETTFSSQFAAQGSTAANGYTMISNGYDSNTSSSASCTIALSGGTTFTGGTIKIYGLANS